MKPISLTYAEEWELGPGGWNSMATARQPCEQGRLTALRNHVPTWNQRQPLVLELLALYSSRPAQVHPLCACVPQLEIPGFLLQIKIVASVALTLGERFQVLPGL